MESWREELYTSDYRSQFFMHHGIKGQQWGIRRYQNPDGTLTAEGKKRYKKQFTDIYTAEQHIARTAREDFSEDVTRISNRMKDNMDEGDSLSKEYNKYYDSIDQNPKFLDAVRKKKAEYGGDEMAEYEAIHDALDDFLPKELKDRRKTFDDNMDSVWSDIENFAQNAADEYSKVYSKSSYVTGFASAKKIGKDFIDSSIRMSLDDMHWYSYMSRHYDDYWIGDTESRQALENRIEKKLKDAETQEKRMAPMIKKAEEYVKTHPGTPMSVDYYSGTITLGSNTFKVG